MTTDETFCPLVFRHHAAGTMKLRKMDAELFDLQGPVVPLTFLDPEGREHQVWANAETGLLLGLQSLYIATGLLPGALIAITPEERPGRFQLSLAGEDEHATISPERLEQLLALAEEAAQMEPSLYELTRQLMSATPEGARFERLHAELNVVRRTTRLQLASLLSYYQCFRPKDSQGDLWGYAPEAIAAGAIASKLKYVVQ